MVMMELCSLSGVGLSAQALRFCEGSCCSSQEQAGQSENTGAAYFFLSGLSMSVRSGGHCAFDGSETKSFDFIT